MENTGTETKTETQVFDEIADYVAGEKFDIEICIDKSGSMKQENRIADAKEFALMAAKVSTKLDEDGGVGILFFSNFKHETDRTQNWNDVPANEIEEKFKNLNASGGTDTYDVLKFKIEQHMERKKTNPTQRTMILVVTDGEPNDKDPIKPYLASVQRQLDFTQKVPELKVVFYQVGRDPGAKAWLEDLDNDNQACGLLVESVYDGKDNRSVPQILFDALREHLVPN